MNPSDTDIALMGPHALARYNSRVLALKSFGIDAGALAEVDNMRALARQSRKQRELVIQADHLPMVQGDRSIVVK